MPDPCQFDSESDFVSACVSERQNEYPDESTSQSVAVCYQMWADRDCKTMNDIREAPSGQVYKAGSAYEVGERDAIFVASTDSVDRAGDIVEQDWDFRAFRQNPVFLFQHIHKSLPIGRVAKVWTDEDESKTGFTTYARVEAPEKGLDEFADKVWRFLKAGLLNAVSVGFLPLVDPEPRIDKKGRFLGFRFPRNELLELSLVSVPANSGALVMAKSMIPEEDIPRFFDVRPSCDKGVSAGSEGARVRQARRYLEIQRLRAGGR